MRSWTTDNEEETRRLGERLADELRPNGVLLLDGDLGAGKTVLAQGVARGLGIDEREVQSPTYTLIREHRGRDGSFLHLDLYRLDSEEVASIGVEELLAGPGVKVVEWASRLPFPATGLRLRLSIGPAGRCAVEETAGLLGCALTSGTQRG